MQVIKYIGIHPREICFQNGIVKTVYENDEFECDDKDALSLLLQQNFKKISKKKEL